MPQQVTVSSIFTAQVKKAAAYSDLAFRPAGGAFMVPRLPVAGDAAVGVQGAAVLVADHDLDRIHRRGEAAGRDDGVLVAPAADARAARLLGHQRAAAVVGAGDLAGLQPGGRHGARVAVAEAAQAGVGHDVAGGEVAEADHAAQAHLGHAVQRARRRSPPPRAARATGGVAGAAVGRRGAAPGARPDRRSSRPPPAPTPPAPPLPIRPSPRWRWPRPTRLTRRPRSRRCPRCPLAGGAAAGSRPARRWRRCPNHRSRAVGHALRGGRAGEGRETTGQDREGERAHVPEVSAGRPRASGIASGLDRGPAEPVAVGVGRAQLEPQRRVQPVGGLPRRQRRQVHAVRAQGAAPDPSPPGTAPGPPRGPARRRRPPGSRCAPACPRGCGTPPA